MSEWVIVEDAHEALISEDEAAAIVEARQNARRKRFDNGYSRSEKSDYLLSGGLFTCGRCGSNLLGMRKTKTASYYICGSQPHRRGLGCGPAVYVPQANIEREVVSGLSELVAVCSDPEGFTRKVNDELKRLWQESNGHDPNAARQLEVINRKIANIRRSIEEGTPDTNWAHNRIQELLEEKSRLEASSVEVGAPPQIDGATAMQYRRSLEKVLAAGTNSERKQLIRTWVDKIELAPETLEVEVTYKIPEAIGEFSGSGGRI